MLLVFFFGLPAHSQDTGGKKEVEDQAPSTWTDTESRLANHYIQLLQKEPAYGKVFDLLWDLYQKHNQVDLLVGYFQKASDAEDPASGIATLLYAHLVRKKGETEKSEILYSRVLERSPESIAAIKALAEIADQQKQFGNALSFYDRLIKWISIDSEDGVAIRLRRAALQKQLGQTEKAIKGWNEILKAFPGNPALRNEIVAMLLEAGETASAISVLKDLAKSTNPREKLDSLLELNRLYEFISDFDNAVATAREGMVLVHFKDHQHDELFARLVSAHERFNHLDLLRKELEVAADRNNPGERDIYLLAEYFRLTADPVREEKAVARLVQKLPADVDYRVRLAEIQMENDRYEAAAETLDEVLKDQPEIPLRLVLLRARVAAIDENPVVAEETLNEYLKKNPGDPAITKKIIEFARSYYLDRLVEKLLRGGGASGVAGSDGDSAPIVLARFLKERGRKKQASDTLLAYVEAAGETTMDRARRFHQVAIAFREIDLPDEAASAITKAIELSPVNVKFLTTKADLLVDEKEIDDAISTLETVRHLQKVLGEKTDTDQRIFTLLRGYYTKDKVDPDAGILKGGAIQSLSQYRKIAAAVSRSNRSSEGGRNSSERLPKEVKEYFAQIKKEANGSPNTESRYRAAWWALKLQDSQECYSQLSAAKREAGKPVIEIEKMLLQLAESKERIALMAGHLATLAKIDPENADEYLQKRAMIRFEMGYEDEAVRQLVKMVAKPDATLNTLNALAKIYKRQGSTTKHIEVWRNAFRKANLFEKRSIIKQLSSALIESKRPEEALKVQIELIEKENDPVQRRKQLDSQLTTGKAHFLLDWLQDQYAALTQKEPFDRFYPEALARIQLAAGHDKEAFASMKKAYYMSGQDSDLLDELGELASRLGDLKSAIYYRRQIISKAGDETSIENWRSLIVMLEKDLRVGEADLLRRRLETKFGQDPEFLGGLARHYRESNHISATERVLRKLVALRVWDVHAMLELGLLESEAGRYEEAEQLFSKIIDQTEDVPIPRSVASRSLWPLIRVPRPGNEKSGEDQLREMAITVESYPTSNRVEIQEKLADWLLQPHPEFDYLPRESFFVRLRAIEEVAAIHSSGELGEERKSKWLSRWVENDAASQNEKLWATRYSASKNSFREILTQQEKKFASEDHIDQIWFSYLMLLAGENSSMVSWSKEEDNLWRSQLLVLVSFLLFKDQAEREPLYNRKLTEKFLAGMSISGGVGTHFFSELQKEGKAERTFFIGEFLAESGVVKNGDFLFMISRMAYQSGQKKEGLYWLDRAIDTMTSNYGPGVPGNYYTALTEKFSLLESDIGRKLFVEEQKRVLEINAASDRATSMEKSMLLDLAMGNNRSAIAALGGLSRTIGGMAKVVIEEDKFRPLDLQDWSKLNSLQTRSAARFSIKSEEESIAFVQALGSGPTFVSGNEKNDREFDVFEIERKSWLLEWQNRQERLATVRDIYANLNNPASVAELTRILRDRGFQKEAAFVFQAELQKSEQGYPSFHGVFDACHESLEPGLALGVIRKLKEREIPIPPGLTVDYLNEQHARFLFHSRDIEKLVQLGKPPEVRKGAPPIKTRVHLPYQYALIRAYQQTGADESLLGFLTRLRENDKLEKSYLLMGAQLLRKKEAYQMAMNWIDDISFDGTHSLIERSAMEEVIRIQEESGDPDKEVILRYTRTSLDTQPVPVTLLLVDALHRAGGSLEAEGIMRLRYRKTKNENYRDQIAIQLLRTRLETGFDWSELGMDLEMYLSGLSRKELIAPIELVKLFAEFPPADVEKVKTELRSFAARMNHEWLARLLISFLEDTLPEEAVKLADDMPRKSLEIFLETLIAFGEIGKSTAASIVDETGLPGDYFFHAAPDRQIPFFAAIGDLTRLQEVHSVLIHEAESAIFNMQNLGPTFPTLRQRYEIPLLLSETGYQDLAGSLFRKYHDGIVVYRWEHTAFLEKYIEFLTAQNQFEEAEGILGRVSQKSFRVDLRLFMNLYEKWGKLDDWEAKTARFQLSAGEKHLLREWRTALAEGKEMVEYDPKWE